MEATAIVADTKLQLVGAPAQANRYPAGSGVFGGIINRFLRDAIQANLNGRIEAYIAMPNVD